MKKPTKKEVEEAAKTKKGALDISIKKHLYLLQLTKNQVRKLHKNFLTDLYYGLCQYYTNNCPLKKQCNGGCIPEWHAMFCAHRRLQNPFDWTQPDEEYNTFLSNTAQIYIKLLKIKGTI